MKSEKVKFNIKPSWRKFAWSTFLFHMWSSNDAYIQLMNDQDFTKQIWETLPNSDNLDTEYVAHRIIKFLQDYGCHTPNNNSGLIRNLIEALQNSTLFLQALYSLEITTINFDNTLCIQGITQSLRDVIKNLYSKFDAIKHIGPTASTKILHILQPRLFVMWDKEICEEYHNISPQVSTSAKGYCAFLEKVKVLANHINQEFNNLGINTTQTPADYLSDKLKIKPPKTLAKYLDEYNWVTITRGVKVPPSWHPDKKKNGTLNRSQLTISYL